MAEQPDLNPGYWIWYWGWHFLHHPIKAWHGFQKWRRVNPG